MKQTKSADTSWSTPVFHGGTFVPKSPDTLRRLHMYDLLACEKGIVTGKLNLTEGVLKRRQLLNSGMAFVPRHRWFRPEAARGVRTVVAALRSGSGIPAGTWRSIVHGWPHLAIAGARKITRNKELFPSIGQGPTLLEFGWSQHCHFTQLWQVLDGFLIAEQAPNPDNRVTLSNDRDQLGRERVNLHWELRRKDIDSVRRTQDVYAEAFLNSGLGKFIPGRLAGEPELIWPGLHHHAGTTRMSSHSADGVVDKDCQVHGVANLYIAGCSVFRTAGYINPTLPILSLAFRLAGRLQNVLKPGGAAHPAAQSFTETFRG